MQVASVSPPETCEDFRNHVACSDDRAILASVLLAPITMAIWQRGSIRTLERWLDRLELDEVDDLRATMALIDGEALLRQKLLDAGYPNDAGCQEFARDIFALARNHADLLDRPDVEVRLEVIETDACRKFHADYGTARLICTYLGPAMQWLDQHETTRHRAGVSPAALDIQQLQTGDVAVFKGRQWAPETALVHRSPPIAETGEKRLVLVIDRPAEQPAI